MQLRRTAARVLAPVLGASVLLGSAGAVLADEPAQYVLDVYSCVVTDVDNNLVEGNVPAGSEIILFEGWIANTRGQLQSFLLNATWQLTVDGDPVDVTPYLSGLIRFGPFWGDLWSFSAGTLASGETLSTHYNLELRAANFDGVFHYAKGPVHGEGINCSVTAD